MESDWTTDSEDSTSIDGPPSNHNEASTSNLELSSTGPAPILLRIQPPQPLSTLQDLADFFERIRLNLYLALRAFLTQVEVSRFEARSSEIRTRYIQSRDDFNEARQVYREALITYEYKKAVLEKTKKWMNVCKDRKSTAESTFNGLRSFSQGAKKRFRKLDDDYEHANINWEGKRGWEVEKLKCRSLRAKTYYEKAEMAYQMYEDVVESERARFKGAFKQYRRKEKAFKEKDRRNYLEARRIYDLAVEEFRERQDICSQEFRALRRAIRNVSFEHDNLILRTVPLFHFNTRRGEEEEEQQLVEQVEELRLEEEREREQRSEEDEREQSVEEARWELFWLQWLLHCLELEMGIHREDHPLQEPVQETPENNIDWENLIYFQVELVIEFRTVTEVYF